MYPESNIRVSKYVTKNSRVKEDATTTAGDFQMFPVRRKKKSATVENIQKHTNLIEYDNQWQQKLILFKCLWIVINMCYSIGLKLCYMLIDYNKPN